MAADSASTLNVSKSRFLITGGMGFIGSAIARRLLKEGAREVCLLGPHDKDLSFAMGSDAADKRLKKVIGDIRDPEVVERAVAGSDYVFHEAGLRVTRCAKEPRFAHEVLVDGTFNVALAAVEQGVKKLIFASSAVVYGDSVQLPIEETHLTRGGSLYGAFKIASEELLAALRIQRGLDYTTLRLFNTYGPGMNVTGSEREVIVCWLDRIDANLSPVVHGDGTQTMDLVYIDDVVEAHWRALRSGGAGEAYNVCSGRETRMLDVLNLLLDIRGSRLNPEFQAPRAVAPVSRRVGSTKKAEEHLGFVSRVPLADGLRALVKWRDSAVSTR